MMMSVAQLLKLIRMTVAHDHCCNSSKSAHSPVITKLMDCKFLARDMQHKPICLARYVLLSVRPSVCRTGGSVKTVEVRSMQFSPYSSLSPLDSVR